MKEVVITAQILKWLKAQPGAKAIKVYGSGMGEDGTPDILGSCRGRFFFLEVKQPGNKPTDLQAQRIAEWQRACAVGGVAHSLDEAKTILAPLLQEQGTS